MNENKYLRELTLNLRREGFTVSPEADGLLPVALDGQHLCTAPERGGIRYRKEDAVIETQTAALDKVIDITRVTAEYMRQLEAVPFLKASGLSEEFKLAGQFQRNRPGGPRGKTRCPICDLGPGLRRNRGDPGALLRSQRDGQLRRREAGLCRPLRADPRQRPFCPRAVGRGLPQYP